MFRTKFETFPGARLHRDGVDFRVWAPDCRSIDVVEEKTSRRFPLKKDRKGYFTGTVPGFKAGTLYKYRVNGKGPFPDPASHFQPKGPLGPSMVVDHGRFRWTDDHWQMKGITLKGQVLYELHIGTYTPEGTFRAVIPHLSALKDLGITVIEFMPLAECAGRWNLGYDGVDLFAAYHVYGTCDDLKALIDHAHSIGLGVIPGIPLRL